MFTINTIELNVQNEKNLTVALVQLILYTSFINTSEAFFIRYRLLNISKFSLHTTIILHK